MEAGEASVATRRREPITASACDVLCNPAVPARAPRHGALAATRSRGLVAGRKEAGSAWLLNEPPG